MIKTIFHTPVLLFIFFCGLFISAQTMAFTLSGTCKQADKSTACSAGTVRFAFDNTLQPYSGTIALGAWSISDLALTAPADNTIITVFIDGALDTQKAVAVTQYDGTGDVAGIELIETHLSIGSDDTPTITNAELALYDYSVSGDSDVFYDINGSGELIVDINNTIPNETLYVKTGTIFQPLGNLSTHHVYLNGTLTADTYTFTVVGDWDFTNGAFNRGFSTVNFTGTGTISNDVEEWWLDKSFYRLNFAKIGQTTTILIGRGIVANDVVTLDGGTLAGGTIILNKSTTPLVNNGGTFVNSSINFSPPSNQAEFYIPADNYPNLWLASNGLTTHTTFIPLGNITCYRLTIYGNGIGKTSILETNGKNISCNNLRIGHSSTNRIGKLIVNSGSTLSIAEDTIIYGTGSNELDATSSTINIGGNWSNSSLFTAGTSTVNVNGNSNQTLSAGGDPFYNLTINNTGAVNSNIVSIDSDITLNNDLTIINGVLDTTANNYNLTILGHLDQSSTTGELEANTSIITVSKDVNLDGTLDSTNYNNASLVLNGTGQIFYGNLSQIWRNGFNNLTVGQAGQTTTTSYTFAVLNELSVGSGTFSGTAFVYLGNYLSIGSPLNLDPNATISINELRFFGGNQTIPPLNNGYDCNIRVSRGNLTVTQTGDITLNEGNHLFLDGDKFIDRSLIYNTNNFDLKVGGDLILGAGGDTSLKTLDISGSNVTVGQDFKIRAGTNKLISTNSTVSFNGSSNQTLFAEDDVFYNITIDNTGAVNDNIVAIGSDLILNNDLIINVGVLDTTANNYNLTVLGNFDQSSTIGKLNANASTLTVTGDFKADGTLSRSNYNNATVKLIGDGTLKYSNLPSEWINGFKNLTVGQAGKTTTLIPSNFNIKEVLTVGSGVFTSTSSVIYLEGTDPLNLDPDATIRLYSLRFFGSGFTQTLPPLNNGYDTRIALSNNNTQVIQTGNVTLNTGMDLLMRGNYSSSRSSHYSTGGFDLNVGGKILLGHGNDTAAKILDISNSTIRVNQGFDIRTGINDFVSTNSTVILNGTATQPVTMSGKAMDDLIIDNPAGVTFKDAFTANSVTNTRAGSTMTFAAGQNFTVNNAITLQGTSGQLINLVSSSPGSYWNFVLNVGITKSIDHVSVSWSDASDSDSTQIPLNPSNTVRNSDTIEWFLMPNFSVTKHTTLISDPINGTGGDKNHIPGAIIEYNLTARNTGSYSPDNNSVIILDVIDANVEFDVSSGVRFIDGSTSSGVSLGAVTYSQRSSPTTYDYTPTGTFDPNVAGIKIETNGSFAFDGTLDPEFTVSYRVHLR